MGILKKVAIVIPPELGRRKKEELITRAVYPMIDGTRSIQYNNDLLKLKEVHQEVGGITCITYTVEKY